MAANLQILRRRIRTSKNISQIAKAMEMIAASKIKRAQTAVSAYRPYAKKIIDTTTNLINHIDSDKFQHPYIEQKSSGKSLLIAISPDKGLCGALVTNLYKKLLEVSDENTGIVTIGKKVERVTNFTPSKLLATFPMGTRLAPFSIIYPIVELINENYSNGEYSKVSIVYTEFKSIFSQEPTHINVLPIVKNPQDQLSQLVYIFEPSSQDILTSLLPYYLEVTLYNAIIGAFTSEQAARMIAMQNAKNNANDIADALTLVYNKSRQERITNELLDLTNGQITATA